MSRLAQCALFILLICYVVPATAQDSIDFGREILPILSDNCFHCHGPDEKSREGGLRLDERESAVRERDGLRAIAPGLSRESEVVKRIESDDPDLRMPPPALKRTLTPAQVELLKRWIDQGAKWGKHWAYEAPKRPAIPEVKRTAWASNVIDRFILARLEREDLSPSDEANRETLVRRITLDLTGLPPTLAEISAFTNDSSTDAYERLVDRLLASPRYGERMAWDWLDAARYADTNGYQGDQTRTMWPWRDWATAALNRNMPFDRFTVEQLAGDQLPNASLEQKIATGFCRNHMINGEGGRIAEENRVEYVMDQVETLGTVWLGATLTCARCHDHKYDPYSQKDYYGLFGFFNQTPVDGGGGSGQTAPVVELLSPEDEARRNDLQQQLEAAQNRVAQFESLLFPREEKQNAGDSPQAAKAEEKVRKVLAKSPADRNPAEWKTLEEAFQKEERSYASAAKAAGDLRKQRDDVSAKIIRVMVMQDRPEPRDTFVLEKGQYNKPLDKVSTATPAMLPPLPETAPRNRAALAEWLVRPDHPLTARVAVNRLWQQLFGAGLVRTPEDFGVQGEKPSHPELLDWLAVELIESGWDVKRIQRLMVTSSTYRQSSKVSPALKERDPENRLLARAPRYRLPAFMLRDQALAVSGLLVERIGGPGVNPYQPSGVWEDATFGLIRYTQDHGEKLYRRGLYTFWRRIIAPTMFFDTATRQTCSVKAGRTNSPLQALLLMNDVTFVEAARHTAEGLLHSEGDDNARITRVYRSLLARAPSNAELAVGNDSLARLRQEFAADQPAAAKLLAQGESKRSEKLDTVEHAAWTAYCLTLFNLDETLTKE